MSLYKLGTFDISSELPTLSVGASFNSAAIEIADAKMFYVNLLIAGSSPTGTFKLQANNDPTNVQSAVDSNQWADIPSSSVSISAAGLTSWNLATQGQKWWRLVWTYVSGSGTVTAFNFTAKP